MLDRLLLIGDMKRMNSRRKKNSRKKKNSRRMMIMDRR